MKIKFRKTSARAWEGNGFGTSAASWEAYDVATGEVVGVFDGDRRMHSIIFGERVPGMRVTDWKKLALKKAEAQA